MKLIDAHLLASLYGQTAEHCIPFVGPLRVAMARYGIDKDLNCSAAFLATAGHESGGLQHLTENLNYGAQGLLKTWPKRFTAQQAQAYARKPEKIANKVYASRMGNGDEASGDGWRFRGGGLIQLTGRDNQTRYAHAAGRPVETIGDWLRTPEGAADSAGWFWDDHGLNAVAIHGDMLPVTLVVNGGQTGLPERKALFVKAKGLLT